MLNRFVRIGDDVPLTPYTRTADGRLHVEATVPIGAEAVLDLEGSAEETLPPGTHSRVVPVPVGTAVPA